jgi:hypothetical protein
MLQDAQRIGAQRDERFNQNGCLDRHVQRPDNPRARQRLFRAVFLAQRHQAWHLGFRDVQFLAAKPGQRDVLDDIILGHSRHSKCQPLLAGQLARGRRPGNAALFTTAGPRSTQDENEAHHGKTPTRVATHVVWPTA